MCIRDSYITSDPEDQIFALAEKENKIRAYYIGEKKLITLMMKMDADVVVMTMPDIENFHIKRSYVRKDIEYIYIPHGMDSLNMTMRTGSMDHYDTVYCVGKHHTEEIRKTEEAYGLPDVYKRQEETTEDMEKMAAIVPSDKPYMKTGVFETFKKRIPWLLLLMVSATFTGAIISSFEDALSVCAVLVAYIPCLLYTSRCV